MFTKFKPVWIMVRRELFDQFRDWRVLAPMLVLILCFPILMDAFAQQTVDFLNQYSANLIIDRLVPFSILIIGFFPITVSLVVALESFVGEKERGTIEPILSSPLEDWQIYFGKLIVGVVTPLIASFLSFGLYMLLVIRRDLTMPSALMIIQLILLTAAHAFLMVSAAIVISVQSTSVKAANLLASFIVIPVAILMQAEAGLLFWGRNESLLWWAILGVTIIALLLIRLGIAHFQREYLLGREIDLINMRWILNTFISHFLRGARSIPQWYRLAVGPTLKRTMPAMIALLLVTVASLWISRTLVLERLPAMIARQPVEKVEELKQHLLETPDLKALSQKVSVPYLFINNTRAVLIAFVFGVISFGVLGVIAYMINIGLIGGLFSVIELLGGQAWPLFIWGVLPHGIFEIPALLIGCSAILYFGASLVTPQTGRSFGESAIELTAQWTQVYIGLVVPLMAIAAVIETYITPALLVAATK